MALKANVLILSLVLLIISSEVIARDMVDPSMSLLEPNDDKKTNGMNDPTLQKIGVKVGMFFDFMCVACKCPKGNNDNNDNDNDNNNNNNNDIVYQAVCC
uniref:Myb-like protein M n=1 Tax=Nicotiana sylvestris TaxID=4096 RepID=A0A1U7X898_NICSY|nr:PREDICTED: myb-like protein M [Nicotiana sylvestris]